MATIVKETEYKGKPYLTIEDDTKTFPFNIGLLKAHWIIQNFDAIKAFYEKYANKPR